MAGYYFGCPHCRAKLEARDASRAGRTVTCPQCQQDLLIPPPPPMGVSLSQTAGNPSAQADASAQVVVSHDPGFKRSMSPAKAFGDAPDALPSPGHSGVDKLAPSEALQAPESHTLEAGDDIEGYSFTVPENDTDVAPSPGFVFKPKKKRTPEEAPHPLEDPKNKLAVLVAIVAVLAGIGAIWSWLGSGDKPDNPVEVTAPTPPPPPPPSNQAAALPGSVPSLPKALPTSTEPARPGHPTPLPDADKLTPKPDPAEAPGAVPNVLPETDSPSQPGTAPRPLPESTPNVLPGTTP